jgi:predicted Zn-dependent protease
MGKKTTSSSLSEGVHQHRMNIRRRSTTLCLLLALLLAAAGCAVSPGTPFSRSEPVSLSPEAKAMYAYLKYMELKKADKPHKALQALKNATSYAPSPELYLEQARHYWGRGKLDAARETIQSGLQKFPGQGDLVRHLARLFIEQDNLDNATSLLSVYLRQHGGDPATVADLAQIYMREERYAKARELLQSVPSERRTPRIHFLLGQSRLEQNQPDKAIPHLREAVEADKEYLKAWARLGFAQEKSGNYTEAKRAYSVLLERGRENDELLLKLAELDLKLNNPDRAMEYVRRDPSGPEFLFRSCSLFLQSGFYDRAEEILGMIPESAREDGRSHYYRAVIALRRDQSLQDAMKHLQGIPSSSRMHRKGLLLKARIQFRDQDQEEALETARQGRRDYPGSASFWILESRILLEQDRPQRARDILQQGLQAISDPSRLWSQLAIVEHELGNSDKALQYMRRLLEKEPENASALNFIGYTLVEQERDLDKAGRLIRQALKLDPGNPYYLDSLAWYQFKTDNSAKAWETIQKAVAQVRDDPKIWEHYADIAFDLEKREEARKGYSKALELNPDDPQSLRDKLERISGS